jgi:CubicO group peptidase (beta-lactamase class C family)
MDAHPSRPRPRAPRLDCWNRGSTRVVSLDLVKRFHAILAAVLLLPSIGFAAAQTAGGILIDKLPGEQAEQIWNWTEKLVQNGWVAGASAQIVREGVVVYRGVHGELELGSGRSVQGDSLFRIYSMSKAITSVAVMQLVEAGKLQLDDPVAKFLPEWGRTTVLQRNEKKQWSRVPLEQPITIRHLLRHTAGIPYGFWESGEMKRLYAQEGEKNGAFRSLDDASKRLASMPLKHQPGTAFTYGSSSDVLGRLVEVVAKQPFDAYLQAHIFAPLGMKDTGFRVGESDRARLASVHDVGQDGKVSSVAKGYDARFFAAKPVPMGGEGLISTLEDYGRFQSMLLAGGIWSNKRLLKASTVALMISPDSAKRDAHPFYGKFGLGFLLRPDGFSLKSKAIRYASWSGIARTYFVNDHQTQTGSLLFTQTMPFNSEPGGSFAVAVKRILAVSASSPTRPKKSELP